MTERIVIYRLGSLGDTVVALPCLHAIETAFPDAERVMLTNIPVSAKAAPLEAILGGSGLVHRFIAYPVGTRALRALMTLRKTLRALDAHTLIYLTPSRGLPAAWRDVLFFRMCGFRRIIGAPLTREQQMNLPGKDGLVERECVRLARCIRDVGPIDLDDHAFWDLRLTPAERADALAALGPAIERPRIAINMGGKAAENDWGEEHWKLLVAELGRSIPEYALVFVGSVEDAGRAERVGALWPGLVVNLCGALPPRVSAAAMAGARLFVGHDSGPMHLAACMGVSCVAMFGTRDASRKFHPYGPSHRVIHEQRGVRMISVERMANAVLEQLGTSRRGDAVATAAESRS